MQYNSSFLHSYLLWLFLLFSTTLYSSVMGVDQGNISEKHIQAKEDFITDSFKDGADYSSTKINKFLERLIKERDVLIDDLYETEIIENVELFVKKIKKAKDFIKFQGEEISWGWGWEENLFQEKKIINIKTGIFENELLFRGRKFKAKHQFLNKENYKLLKNFKYGDKVIFLTNYEWNHLKEERTI